MIENWTYKNLKQLIDDQVEENLNLDYKAADALGKTDSKKKEISKDVSSMANSDGGIIIYGVKEYSSKEKKHLPEKIDPVKRTEYSKEWLEHVINNIRPKIKNLKIHPINIGSDNTHCVYVVDIPKSTTAHQAVDFRYYKRYNFESVPMVDYEIKDIMNRAQIPNVDVEFTLKIISTGSIHEYSLQIHVINNSEKIVNHFKLEFEIPRIIQVFPGFLNYYFDDKKNEKHIFTYISSNVLFPREKYDIGKEIQVRYKINKEIYDFLCKREQERKPIVLKWILYADDMPSKKDKIVFSELNVF